ncbi:MAG: methyltransferase domain-containing protein [Nanoarchaeota archaeon]|nr:methyltransferase domain-containing protein [Nanoarchaeota archaeon]
MKINYGCGYDKKEGWINIDTNKECKPDILINKNNLKLPFEDETIEYILSRYCLEHINKENIQELIREFHRILINKGILELYLPHYTGTHIKYLDHKTMFGINSFYGNDIRCKNPTNKNEPKFKIKQNLTLFGCESYQSKNPFIVRGVNKLSFLFNVTETWQKICEKYLWGGFEEIHYIMEKIK